MPVMILAGDAGGTKTRLAIYTADEGKFVRGQTETFQSAGQRSLEEVIQIFLTKHRVSVAGACIGVPGPVVRGEAKTTNLPWLVRETAISSSLGIPKVMLVNDLAATAAAIPYFSTADLVTLHEGSLTGAESIFAVLAPGTGLGQAFLLNDRKAHHVFPSEGGHVDFAPSSEIEEELLRYLKKTFSRVSYERVLSGPGLVNIYTFLKEGRAMQEPESLGRRLKDGNPAAVISQTGLAGEFEICVKALDVFASVLGSQAGNLVLTLVATGGVYLGGGIPPKICSKLTDGTVVKSYLNKARLSNLVESTPLHVILDDHAALLGAASMAASML